MSKTKLTVIIALIFLIFGIASYAPEYLNLEFLKSKLTHVLQYKTNHPIKAILLFSAIYIFCVAASVPGALVLTVASGAFFGFVVGSLVALISAAIGATMAFGIARYLLDDYVQKKMGERLTKIRDNFQKEGALYLFSMRLVPIFPFFAINLLMALTPIKARVFAIVSLIGMAPGTMVFVNAGTQIAKIESLKDILSAQLMFSFVLLAIFPYIAKYILKLVKNRIGHG